MVLSYFVSVTEIFLCILRQVRGVYDVLKHTGPMALGKIRAEYNQVCIATYVLMIIR